MATLEFESPTVAAIYEAYVVCDDDDERVYLGASVIGEECARKLWYGFRWATEPEHFDGRMLRLFQTGHREESRMIDDLRRSGVEVWDVDPETGRQWDVSEVGGHFRGHLDGVALGVREAPKTAHLLECKTHNAKSFARLRAEGVRKAKPQHYAQMQVYMHLMSLKRALYLAHGKDDDMLHAERIEYDPVFAARLMALAHSIVTATTPPARLHDDPEARMAFACRYCQALAHCHHGAWARRNCRTCLYATPMLDGDGRWLCERHDHELALEDQRAGCAQHLYIPALVPGEQIDADEARGTVTYEVKGVAFVDGQTENPRQDEAAR